MTQLGATQENLQGFRSVYLSEPHTTTSAPLNSPNITHIIYYTDPDTNKDFILWEDIQQAFDEVVFVRNKTKMLPFVRGKDHRVLEPRRIAAAPDVVLDVVVGDEQVATNDTATADMIASLQRTVQELLLNIPRRTSIESVTHVLPCGSETKATQTNNYNDNPDDTSLIRGPRTSECHLEDSNKGVLDTQRSEATSKVTTRLDDPHDETAARNMTLMQTMIRANDGDIHAQVALGDRYKDGREVHQDHQVAMDWYLMAAEQSHHRAQYHIGLMYDQGHYGGPQDHFKAFEWFLKSALQGYVDAQAKVSQAYTDGAGVPQDNIKAMEWAVKAAENGHAERQHYMGAAYEMGHGVPQSDSRSFEWYLKSAGQGFAEAQVQVAASFEAGRGVSEDGLKAVEWYTKAANQGIPLAQFALGRIYELGLRGIPKDLSKAVGWFIEAAVQGHTEAQSMLREIYDLSTSDSDSDFALDQETQSMIKEWFIEAAGQGVAHAQVCMAYMYSGGRGVDEDNFKTFEWYLKAAEQGDKEAQEQVAYMYEIGRGVSNSHEKAIVWYVRLAKSGNSGAVDILKDMIKNKI